MGVNGIDLLAYRFVGDAVALINQFVAAIDIPVCIAGSIDTYERIDFMKRLAPWGFTMGSALFKKNFAPKGSFRENLETVSNYLKDKTVSVTA